jgi:hypothetical protein
MAGDQEHSRAREEQAIDSGADALHKDAIEEGANSAQQADEDVHNGFRGGSRVGMLAWETAVGFNSVRKSGGADYATRTETRLIHCQGADFSPS